MTDIKRTVEIIFAGRDDISKQIREISRDLSQVDFVAQQVAQPLARVGDIVLGLDAALAAFAVGGIAYAIKQSIDYENATIELEKVLGDETGRLEELQEAASDLAMEYGQSASAVLGSAAAFKQAGFDASDAMLLTKAAMDLVISGGVDAAEASELLTATLKGFKAPAEEAGHVIDILNEVSNNYATDVEQLATGMARLSPIASQMGFSFEETAGLLTPVIEVFRSGDEAANALKTGLLRLVDDSKPVAQALEQLGVSQRDANGEMKSGKEILYEVATAFQHAEDNDKAFLTQQLVGINQSPKMIEVFNGLAKSAEVTAVAMGSSGSAAKEVAIRLESAQVALDRTKVGFEELGRVVGDRFLGSAKDALGGIADIEKALINAVEGGTFDAFFKAIGSAGDEMSKLFADIAKNLPAALSQVDFSGLLDAIQDLGKQFGLLFEDVDLSTPEGLAAAIQFVVDSLESLTRVTEGMVAYLKPVWDSIKEGIEDFNGLDDSAKIAAGEFLGAAELIVNAGTAIGGALIAIQKSGADIERVFDVVAGTIGGIWNILQMTFDEVSLSVLTFLDSFLWGMEQVAAVGKLWGSDWADEIDRVRMSLLDAAKGAQAFQNQNFNEYMQDGQQIWDGLAGSVKKTSDAIEQVKTPKINPDIDMTAILAVGDIMRAVFPGTMYMTIGATVDASISQTEATLETAIPKTKNENVVLTLDDGSLLLTNHAIDAGLPAGDLGYISQLVQVEADPESLKKTSDYVLAELKESSDNFRTMFEWDAKINLAEIEAAAKTFETSMSSVDSGIIETTKLMTSAFDAMTSSSFTARTEARQVLDQEQEYRKQEFELQKKLVEAQTRALEKGEIAIKVDATGVEPALEMIMWQILEKVQIRANESSAEFLLGIA